MKSSRVAALMLLIAGCAGAASERASAQAVGGALTVDAEALGAHGDDAIDDTAAIQAAIDAAQAAPGSRVRLPAGRLLVGDRAPLDSVALRVVGAHGLEIVGAGRDATVLELRSEVEAHVISVASSRDVAIEALAIVGDRRHASGHGVRGEDLDGLTIRDVSVRDAAHYGIGLQRGALRRIRIERVSVEDSGGDGIDFKNTAGANADLVLRDVTVVRPGRTSPRQAGIDVRGPASLERVTVREVPPGATGIRFREDGPATGAGGHRSSLTEFAVSAAPDAVGVAVAADDVRVSSGVIEGGWSGVHVIGARAVLDRVEVRGAARYGFRISEPAAGARLERCIARDAPAGVWVEARGARVSRCEIVGSAECTICLRPTAIDTMLDANVTR